MVEVTGGAEWWRGCKTPAEQPGGLREPELNGSAGTVTNHRVAGKVDKPDVAGGGWV